MNLSARLRELGYPFLIAAVSVSLVVGAALLAEQQYMTHRFAAVLVGGVVFIAAAFFSGNPRLFCLWGLGFSIPFMFAKTFGTVLNKGGGEVAFNIDVTDIFLSALLVFLVIDIYTRRRPGIRLPKAAFLWMAIMLFGVDAIVFGPYRTTAAHETVRMIKMLLLFVVLCHELETPRRIMHWCGALSTGLLVNAIVGLAQYYYRASFGLGDLGEPNAKVIETLAENSVRGEEVWRVGAFLLHPNIFGAFLAALLPLMLASLLVSRKITHRAYFLGAFALGVMALLATESRTGWISFSAASLCLLALSLNHSGLRQRSLATTIISGILLVAIAFAARDKIERRIFDSNKEALAFRKVFEGDAARMIADKPVWGSGLNSYVLELPNYSEYTYGSWPPPVHEIYYLWCAETGFVGLALHLTMWGGIIWVGLRNLRVRHNQMFAINAACLAGMLAFALDGLASFSLRITPTLKTFWVLSAMIMAIHYWRLRCEERVPAIVARRPLLHGSTAASPLIHRPLGNPS